jgi:hypothetical protein
VRRLLPGEGVTAASAGDPLSRQAGDFGLGLDHRVRRVARALIGRERARLVRARSVAREIVAPEWRQRQGGVQGDLAIFFPRGLSPAVKTTGSLRDSHASVPFQTKWPK